MSYEYTDSTGDKLRINSNGYGGATLIAEGKQLLPRKTIRVEHEDVPTVAAELLKAAGHHYLAGYIEGGIDVQERAEKAEAEAAEKKLQERRDALAKKYHGLDFVHIGEGGQRVINDIIELQDKLDGASRD